MLYRLPTEADKAMFIAGSKPLDTLVTDMESHVKMMEEFKQDSFKGFTSLLWQLALNIAGQSENPLVLTGKAIDESKMEALAMETKNVQLQFTLDCYRMQAVSEFLIQWRQPSWNIFCQVTQAISYTVMPSFIVAMSSTELYLWRLFSGWPICREDGILWATGIPRSVDAPVSPISRWCQLLLVLPHQKRILQIQPFLFSFLWINQAPFLLSGSFLRGAGIGENSDSKERPSRKEGKVCRGLCCSLHNWRVCSPCATTVNFEQPNRFSEPFSSGSLPEMLIAYTTLI